MNITIDMLIEEFQKDRWFLWSRDESQLAVKEIERLRKRIAELKIEQRWIHQDKTLIIKKGGDSWCAVMPDFRDLQQSESYWFSGDVNKYMDDVYFCLDPLLNPPKASE